MTGIHELVPAPRLGGKTTFVLFVAVLLAFVAETQITQYLQTTLQYRQSYFIFYIVHSCFSLSLPIHLVYLLATTELEVRPLLSGLRYAVMRQLSPVSGSFQDIHLRKFPIVKAVLIMGALTVFYNMPGLLWFVAVPLASVTDVTAIWNANAFFTYIFSVILLGMDWGLLRLTAVCLATFGVMTIVYGGTTASPLGPESMQTSAVQVSSPFVGDMLTLIASVGYALYQVIYKKYIALPTDPDLELPSESSHYRSLATAEDLVDEENSSPALLKGSLVYPPPFGLHPNLVTTSIGVFTFLVLWIPIPILHYYRLEEFHLPTRPDVLIAIAGITASGVMFNAGFMILLGAWGPIVTSVGSLLTIVLTLFSDLIFGTVALTLGGLIGTGMIVGAFAVLVYDML
ncbi:hypothetical protein V8B97DRAFT_1968410 [Scleroderma yunnanense]